MCLLVASELSDAKNQAHTVSVKCTIFEVEGM